MPRRSREISVTGVYHVMIRGINRDRIFHGEIDYLKFEKILKTVVSPKEENGELMEAGCKIYAYCLMPNHVHLLIKEGTEDIGTVMKRIGIAYVSYYNKHYDRRGPLFEGRFKSEPVQDVGYFVTLLRYIHQNPVEAGMVAIPDDYRWSSWHEYLSRDLLPQSICEFSVPFAGMSRDELCELVLRVNEAYSHDNPRLSSRRLSNHDALNKINDLLPQGMGIDDVPKMEEADRAGLMQSALLAGVGMRQLARILSVDYSAVRRAKYALDKMNE